MRDHGKRRHLIDCRIRQWPGLDSFGATRCAAGIKHPGACCLVRNRRCRHRRDGFIPRHETIDRAAQTVTRDRCRYRRCGRRKTCACDQHGSTTIVQDIVNLVRRQLGRNANEQQPGSLRAPDQRVKFRDIVDEQRNAVSRLQSFCAQQLRDPVRRCVELGIGRNSPGFGNDNCRFIRRRYGVAKRMHDVTLPRLTLVCFTQT